MTAVRAPEPASPDEQPDRDAPVLLCPSCNVAYPASATYCGEDGTPLEKIEKYVMSPLDRGKPEGRKSHGRPSLSDGSDEVGYGGVWPWMRFVVPAVVIILVFIAGYLYFGAYEGGAAAVEREIGAALKTRGLDVTVTLDGKDKAVLKGIVATPVDRDAALTIARSHKNVKEVVNELTIAPSPIETERTLNKALDAAGLTGVQTEVDGDFRVLLTGVVRNERESTLAVKTVKAYPEVRSARNDIKVEKKGSSLVGAAGESGSFTETRQFTLSPLSPSSWASLKYRSSVAFRVPGPGRLTVVASWEPQGTLALMVNQADTGATHAQKDGSAPLKLNYRITPGDYAKGAAWEAIIANFTPRGAVKGTLKVTYESSASAAGRPVLDTIKGKKDAVEASKTEKDLNEALKAEGLASVNAQVSKDGTATLKGSAPSAEAKERAISIARRNKLIKAVKDIIFVVGS